MKHARWTSLLLLLVGMKSAAAQSYRTGSDNPRWSLTGFGAAVAVGEREVLIAEPLNVRKSGVIYVYRRDRAGTWAEAQRLTASDASLGDRFGRAMAVDGATLIVGATSRDTSLGGAYAFQRDVMGRWAETQRLAASDGVRPDALGRMAALAGDLAAVASWGHNKSAGAVYLYRRDPAGRWTEEAKLTANDGAANDFFGSAIAIRGDRVLVGASQKNQRTGAAYLFRRDAGGAWQQETKLEAAGLQQNNGFGFAVAFRDNEAYVAAPGYAGSGTVFVFGYDAAAGTWGERGRLYPFDGDARSGFGGSLEFVGSELWVGAPGVAEGTGRVYRLRRDQASGSWIAATKLGIEGLQVRDQFGGSLAVRGDVAAIGLTGADFGEGIAAIFERDARTGEWASKARVLSEIEPLAAVRGNKVDCRDGGASIFKCNQVDLLSFLPISSIGGRRGVQLSGVWGWTDPTTGREYALPGRVDALVFVDVTDPSNPVYLGELPHTPGARPSSWREIKVYKDHAFIVSDGAGKHGVQVFDLRQLRNVRNPPVTFAPTAVYDRVFSAHNIVINEESGFAYSVGGSMGGETCGGGLHIINIQDPGKPAFVGCFADASTGIRKTGYTHDAQCVIYRGPDAQHRGKEICLGSNETVISIQDVTDKANPKVLARGEYPNVGYTHQGWLTEDQRYFYVNDEGDEFSGSVAGTRTLIWDVSDLDDPVLAKEYIADNKAVDHNLYVRGHYMFQSNYVAGLRVYDITDPVNPVLSGFFDTVPWGPDVPTFAGSWSNYPFFKSGNVAVVSMGEGLFIVKNRERLVP